VRVNAAGPMILTRALLPRLRHGAPGKVVNLSSRTASMIVGAEICWDIGYNASKAALNAITVRTARLVADDGVIVVAIHPGWIRTEMGGPTADLDADEAAAELVKTINDLSIEQSGMFLHRNGSPHPW
jgi:NAD(P)-dependent dehydrogenase (short-subunit alcohol dehydrogenase family)